MSEVRGPAAGTPSGISQARAGETGRRSALGVTLALPAPLDRGLRRSLQSD